MARPVIGTKSVLKCRGPVTPETKCVVYEVEIKKIGYDPEPFVIADAHMFADEHHIVMFKNISMKMSGIVEKEIKDFWENRNRQVSAPLFNRERILAFAEGKPSTAFGEPYAIFDYDRRIARLPRPPYFFMDRVIKAAPEPWVLKPGGWIEAQYDLRGDAWFFTADGSGTMPFCVLLEIALQPCGWLAAYLGSALKSKVDLKFRNLGGRAILHHQIFPETKTLTMRCRMTKVSEAGGMIIEHFDMEVLDGRRMIYSGETSFGFFTKTALEQQVGIRGVEQSSYVPTAREQNSTEISLLEKRSPQKPDDPKVSPAPPMTLPAKALLMIDEIETFIPNGGSCGLGFIRGLKAVDADEWFFKAHFYQDPVCPGSLGIESFIQLIKFAAINRWPDLIHSHRTELISGNPHIWAYRGQVVPKNRSVCVEADIIAIEDEPFPSISANGILKVDGLAIYEMKDFGIRLISA